VAISAKLKEQRGPSTHLTACLAALSERRSCWPECPQWANIQANTFPSELAGYLDANCAMGHSLTGLREAID
jgi:hypothetical protein